MKTFAAAALTDHTGDLLAAATLAPVMITKHRKPRFVIMSYEKYEQMSGESSSQFTVSVADMPEALGALLDKGIEDFLDDI